MFLIDAYQNNECSIGSLFRVQGPSFIYFTARQCTEWTNPLRGANQFSPCLRCCSIVILIRISSCFLSVPIVPIHDTRSVRRPESKVQHENLHGRASCWLRQELAHHVLLHRGRPSDSNRRMWLCQPTLQYLAVAVYRPVFIVLLFTNNRCINLFCSFLNRTVFKRRSHLWNQSFTDFTYFSLVYTWDSNGFFFWLINHICEAIDREFTRRDSFKHCIVPVRDFWNLLATSCVWGLATSCVRGLATSCVWGLATSCVWGLPTLCVWGLSTSCVWGLATSCVWGLAASCVWGLATSCVWGLSTSCIWGLVTSCVWGLATLIAIIESQESDMGLNFSLR